ncbi:MAG: S-layer homology domain-containing protein [Leptolyngbyaceae cyanobacterium]
MAPTVLYVDPARGQDNRNGQSSTQALKTITAALQLSRSETIIHLGPGEYSSGERFPLTIPSGCQLRGSASGDRPSTIIRGGGQVQHPFLGTQSVACVLQANASINTAVITNPKSQGIGVWLAGDQARLQKVWVQQCAQYGAVVVGNTLPDLQNSLFQNCNQAGLVFFSQSKGQLNRVFCRSCGIGLWLRDAAAPYISASSFDQCNTGVLISDTAYPVLRRTRIVRNRQQGLQVTHQGNVDLGLSQDIGENVFRQNGQADISNETGQYIISCGNDVLPQRLQGPIDLIASELPDPSTIPPLLFEQPTDFPSAMEGAESTEEPPAPTIPETFQGSRRFPDMVDHWAGPFVDGLVQAGAIAGFPDGTFRPEQIVSRAEFAAFIVASYPQIGATQSPRQFSDLTADFWAYAALSQAQAQGFLSGFPDGTLRPNLPITRIQAIVAVTNGLGLSGGRADDIGIYRDRAQVPSYAGEALATATRQRLVVNFPEPLQLRPMQPITRGELSALIYQGRVALGTSPQVASPYIVEPDTTQTLYSDLGQHWAAEFIRGLTIANLVNGMEDGRFAPEAPINRAQFATLIENAFQPDPIKAQATFADVPPDFWAAEAIQSAYQSNFMTGFPDQTFAPNHPLLRVQVWVALVNGLFHQTSPAGLNRLDDFIDSHTLPDYARQQTAIALRQKLVTITPGDSRLRPNQVASRAEASVAIYQGLVAKNRLPAIASDYIL